MKIKVEMAFDYGKEHFSGGIHECNDVNIIRHMKKCGYGKLIEGSIKANEEAPIKDETPIKEEAPEKPKARCGRPRKKA